MSENADKPNDLCKLNDDDLGAVTGGIGIWSAKYEASYQREYKDSDSTDTFDNWFKQRTIAGFKRSGIDLSAKDLANLGDALKARQFWLSDGQQSGKTFYCSDGVLTYVV